MIPLEPTPYDTVPYANLAFAQTHPDRLATVARIFGLAPADVSRCRVLELGCASGGNLIPMAFNLPGSTFVGVDLSGTQVRDGQATIDALGLGNITIEQASILDVAGDWGEFDYIICHGVFSWVETPVQDKILQIAAENLSANGIAYVSYNTYPGWHMREMVRHMMRYHAGRFDEAAEQIEQARALLAFLASVSSDSEPYGQLLNREIERLSQADDSYLYHEHLEQTNAPTYFHQFAERAERAGLQYLSEADISDMLSSTFPAEIAETLERISPDILHLEQYMDFVRNRQFRQTLLCRKGLRPTRALTPSFLHGLFVSSAARPESDSLDLSAGTKVVFRKGKQSAEVTLPATKAALAILMEQWPRAIEVDELCTMAIARAAPHLETSADDARRSTIGDLFGGVMYGMIVLHSQAPACTNTPSEIPRANGLVAFQAADHEVVVNVRHELVRLDKLGREVLRAANGERRRPELVEALVERVLSGALTVKVDEETIVDADAVRPILAEAMDDTLAGLARAGLLTS